ncbi:MAG: HTH-type transcriptional regulator CysB [Ferrovum myxofaciens]|nr:HTH-type transcriptional regulator CysB [Ferrovum myxofaciens]MBU6995291.1 HTH-type transcriptional regulator CysB [Ferrovum myxofaciens]
MSSGSGVGGSLVKLQQLRYLVEVVEAGLNVSQAADNLFTSQPGVSKQIRLLEDELGVEIFVRNGKRVVSVTPAGQEILTLARRVLLEARNLKTAGQEFSRQRAGQLTVATTHTQARYVLPPVIVQFAQRYPEVKLVLHQGNPLHVAQEVVAGRADLAIATEGLDLFPDLRILPCYQWNRILVAKPDHPLLALEHLTLEALAQYPMITYDHAFTGRARINQAFERQGLSPNVVLTALDADVIKTYVRVGMGVGVIAAMAYDQNLDRDLRARDMAHLFEPSLTRIALRAGTYLRGFVYDFIQLFAPALDRTRVENALAAPAPNPEDESS